MPLLAVSEHEDDFSENLFAERHIGTVVSNSDEEGLGAVRCTIPSIYENIEYQYLPWITQIDSAGFGGSSFKVPPIGSEVLVSFLHKDPYHPVYEGVVKNENTISSEFGHNNPYKEGFVDEFGFQQINDKRRGSIRLKHKSGSSILFEKNGDIIIEAKGNLTERTSDGLSQRILNQESGIETRINVKVNERIEKLESTIGELIQSIGNEITIVEGSKEHTVLGYQKRKTGGTLNEVVLFDHNSTAINRKETHSGLHEIIDSLGRFQTIVTGNDIENVVTGNITKLIQVGNYLFDTLAGVIIHGGADSQPILRGADLAQWLATHTHPSPSGGSTLFPNEVADIIKFISKKNLME